MEILVLNPNSSAEVTATIDRSIGSIRQRTGHTIVCDDLKAAPIGIETDAHVAQVTPMVAEAVAGSSADVVVVACFSDPGVEAARATRTRPVIGIAEAAYYAALQWAPRFGVVSLGPASIARHAVHLDRLGLSARLAGDRSINLSVAEASDVGFSSAVVIQIARALRDEDGAGALVLGCAGMGGHRAALQDALGIPVIDPVQAAVAAAIVGLDLNYNVKG